MAQSKVPLWKEVTPVWIFRCRPENLSSSEHWVCPGPFWLQGWVGLLAIHVACFVVFFMNGFKHGYRPELFVYLAPLVPLWLFCVSADIRYRLHKPTKAQRTAFDNAVLNYCGLLATFLSFVVGLPALLLSCLWQWLR